MGLFLSALPLVGLFIFLQFLFVSQEISEGQGKFKYPFPSA
uniref:Uncharacterized protein n=1 Tax=Rhizophora mucronata TaxID=61149 RepID=A0A2P2KGA8_RHIMU